MHCCFFVCFCQEPILKIWLQIVVKARAINFDALHQLLYLFTTYIALNANSLTFPNIHFFPDLQQNSLTFPWLLPSLEFPWLFPDRWTPCGVFVARVIALHWPRLGRRLSRRYCFADHAVKQSVMHAPGFAAASQCHTRRVTLTQNNARTVASWYK